MLLSGKKKKKEDIMLRQPCLDAEEALGCAKQPFVSQDSPGWDRNQWGASPPDL